MNIIFITGTSKGIGRELVHTFIKNNYTVYEISRNFDDTFLNQTSRLNLDLSQIELVKKFNFISFESNVESITLINNAGTLGDIKNIEDLDVDTICNVANVNYLSVAILSSKFIQKYTNINCRKRIINISSGASASPYDSWSMYCSTKAAIEMFGKVLNLEQASKNYPIEVLSISPGVVETDMQLQIRNTKKEDFSYKDKFVNLFLNKQLFSTNYVANEIYKIVEEINIYKEKSFKIF